MKSINVKFKVKDDRTGYREGMIQICGVYERHIETGTTLVGIDIQGKDRVILDDVTEDKIKRDRIKIEQALLCAEITRITLDLKNI